eukprot:2416079-Heterocapsa_arctica.AAC.1
MFLRLKIDSQAHMLCKTISVLRGISWRQRGCPKTSQTHCLNNKTFEVIYTCMRTPEGPTD